MSFSKFGCFVLALSSPLLSGEYIDVTKYGYEQYQDIIINGEVVQKATHNHKHCDLRYEIIKKVLSQYQRPFTMLDIGASQGYYSFRAAADYPNSVFVMIEGNNHHYPLSGTQLLDLCKANTSLHNVIHLNKKFILEDAKRLSECEHFDVVLAMNIIHRFRDSWREIAESILNMGSHVIVETPPQEAIFNTEDQNNLRRDIENFLVEKNGVVIARVPRHTSDTESNIYLLSPEKQVLKRKTWLWEPLKEDNHRVVADFHQKKLVKKSKDGFLESDWIPGINLLTFKMYQGAYPTVDTLKELMGGLRGLNHTDWMVNNMIVQGNKLEMIDFNDPTFQVGKGKEKYKPTPENYALHCQLLELEDPLKVEHYFWNYLVRYPIQKKEINNFVNSLIKKDDLVFDLGARFGEYTQIYSSHHAKVVALDSNLTCQDLLHRTFDNNEQVAICGKKLVAERGQAEDEITLQEMFEVYGVPNYCSFGFKESESVLLTLPFPIECISFSFDMQNIDSIERSMEHLKALGYQSFNFSSREHPHFMLKNWVEDQLLEKLNETAQKDHEGHLLWGSIHACINKELHPIKRRF